MTTTVKPATLIVLVFMSLMMTACFVEDPGPRQETERIYSIVDFDRLEMGSALHVEVEQGDFFSVSVSGDRRNIEDLEVRKEGSTLVITYRNHRERRHDTFVSITMPYLQAVTFSGGSESRVSGFVADETLDIFLSGASVCQFVADAPQLNVVLSGASYLNIRGSGHSLTADVSGASALKAFNFPVAIAKVDLSGASDAAVAVGEVLEVAATGASHLVYRGTPSLSSDITGSSSVEHEHL